MISGVDTTFLVELEIQEAVGAKYGAQKPFDLVHKVAKVERLRQDPRVLGSVVVRIERDRGKASYEHNFDLGIEPGRATSKLESVHLRHDDIGEQKFEGLLA